MQFEMNLAFSVITAILVLLVGREAVKRVAFLHTYSIPIPVVGGLLAAFLLTLGRFTLGLEIDFNLELQPVLLLVFFTTIGLGADVKSLGKGGRKLLLLMFVVILALIVQNGFGVAIAMAMDLNPLMGLLGGSITLTGGHGTGAAYGKIFSEINNLHGAIELAIACATFGLVLGGLIGGPVAQWLIKRHNLRSTEKNTNSLSDGSLKDNPVKEMNSESFLETILILAVCLGIGLWLADRITIPGMTLPSFVWCLLVGIVIRNTVTVRNFYQVDMQSIQLLGTVSLSLFLAMALMSLRLWELINLALPILVILTVQAAVMAIFAAFVTFRVMGKDYDASVIAAGQCGFQLGATPTAIANMQAVSSKYGYSTVAFLLIPVIGAFLIDIFNALIIQGYLALPVFGF